MIVLDTMFAVTLVLGAACLVVCVIALARGAGPEVVKRMVLVQLVLCMALSGHALFYEAMFGTAENIGGRMFTMIFLLIVFGGIYLAIEWMEKRQDRKMAQFRDDLFNGADEYSTRKKANEKSSDHVNSPRARGGGKQ